MGRSFFVYGHGGTGKTFLWKTIIGKLRSQGKIVLAVASSGIAALLIEGGRTTHSRFKIILLINEHSMCDIKPNSMLAELIRETALVIWDEAPMCHRYVFEAVDKTFRDIMRKTNVDALDKPFGVPDELLIREDNNGVDAVIDSVYQDLGSNYMNVDYLRDRAILTPKNADVDNINQRMLDQLPGDSIIYHSADSICKGSVNYESQVGMYPTEYLNSLKFTGIPNHELVLKVGCPIMLLRNLNPSRGLCNDTRLIITQLAKWVLEALIVTGNHVGEKVFIPRLLLSPTDSGFPFVLKRTQFPIALCYAMPINKSQGQTLRSVGLYLPNPVFSHGQFYVAISRVTSPLGLKILLSSSTHPTSICTKNIVFREVFDGI